jgi:hypothetical protein
MARQGKIARLPARLKSEVNRRLFDGQGAPQILPWLNSQPDAIRVWEALFEGEPASAQNLSAWRIAGYKEWLAQRERVENLKEISAYSLELVKASGGNISDGAAAIAAGHLVEAIENIGNLAVTGGSDDAEADPFKGLSAVTNAIATLRKGDRDRETSARKNETLALNKKRHQLAAEQVALQREKFERLTVAKFMEFARTPEVQALLSGRESKAVQMDKLHQMLFGERPDKEAVHE